MQKLGLEMASGRAEVALHGYLTIGQVKQVVGGTGDLATDWFEVTLDDRMHGTTRRLPGSDDMMTAVKTAAEGVLTSYVQQQVARSGSWDRQEAYEALLKESVARTLHITGIPTDLPLEPAPTGAQSNDDSE
jgi:hypothetical protein